MFMIVLARIETNHRTIDPYYPYIASKDAKICSSYAPANCSILTF
jgi:hypothetical protein